MATTLSLEELKNTVRAIFSKALEAVNPYERIKDILRIEKNHLFVALDNGQQNRLDLDSFKRVLLAGAGKASASMARAVEEIFGDRLTMGIITTKYGHTLPLRRTETIEAGHPIPDQKGLAATEKMAQLLKNSGPRDLVLFLLSGGASALMPMPGNAILLQEKQEVTQLLLHYYPRYHHR